MKPSHFSFVPLSNEKAATRRRRLQTATGCYRTGRTLSRLDGLPRTLFIPLRAKSVSVSAVSCASAFSAAVLISVRVAGSQQDLNLRPVNRSSMLYPAELCEPVYPLELHVRRAPKLSVTLHPCGEDGLGIHRVSHIPLRRCLETVWHSLHPSPCAYLQVS